MQHGHTTKVESTICPKFDKLFFVRNLYSLKIYNNFISRSKSKASIELHLHYVKNILQK
uniref:Uncharacterized protein n=1 Tax=Physcomitrium patens TaxID=3218 RepID=A0A2K1IB49_PHYPA|nr:hypothetical protein PHYPA_031070 [Physcomitrium patens]